MPAGHAQLGFRVSQSAKTFREAYMSADRRVLGAARIGFGLVLLYDLIRKARVLDLFYTNQGLLSNHYVLFVPQDRPQLSLLMGFSTPGEVRVMFALIGVVYLLYTFGLFTRVAQVLSLLLFVSLNTRNLFLEDGGIATMTCFAIWTLFLPLGDRLSLDALRREAALPHLRARIKLRKRLEAPVVSLAVLALGLQIAVIYWLNAVHKTGPTWREGSAVHYVLWQNRVTTQFAWWLAHHEPPWLSWVATKATLVVEYGIPLLILYPYAAWTRILAFGLSVALHLGIAFVMTLGPFSYAMISLVSSRLPPEALVFVARRAPRSLTLKLRLLRARLVRRLSVYVRRGVPRPPIRTLPWTKLREGTLAFLILCATIELSQTNPAIWLKIPQPEWMRLIVRYPRMHQRWTMFAPHAPTEDGFGVVDAETEDGRHVDPFTGREPDFEAIKRGPLRETVEGVDYLFAIHWQPNEPYRRELGRWLDQYHERDGRTEKDRLIGYEVWWVSHNSPKPGSTTPGPLRRQSMLKRGYMREPAPFTGETLQK
jgi:hypothetical protein